MNGTWKIISKEDFYDGALVTMAEGQIDEDGFCGGISAQA